MFLAIVLFLQIPAVPQSGLDALSAATATEATVTPKEAAAPAVSATGQPAAEAAPANTETTATRPGPEAQFEEPKPQLVMLLAPAGGFAAGSISVTELREENRMHEKRQFEEWLALGAISHTAAAFDAWTTRRVVSSGRGQELDPMMRPFAGNASIYVAVQAGPALLDYLARRMMHSTHPWLRRTWWVPQAASAGVSLGSGIHNLGVYSNP